MRPRLDSQNPLNSFLDKNIVREIIKKNILTYKSLKYAFLKLEGEESNNDYPLYRLANVALDYETSRKETLDALDNLSDVLMANVPKGVFGHNINELIFSKYGTCPKQVRMIRELNSPKCYCLIKLNESCSVCSGKTTVAESIVDDLDNKIYSCYVHGTKMSQDEIPLKVVETKWFEFDFFNSFPISDNYYQEQITEYNDRVF